MSKSWPRPSLARLLTEPTTSFDAANEPYGFQRTAEDQTVFPQRSATHTLSHIDGEYRKNLRQEGPEDAMTTCLLELAQGL
jgi:hypothetical protein